VLIPLAALWATGVVVAVPFVIWWVGDAGRIPGRVWYWSGYDRRAWRWAVFLGFLAGGVIAIVTVLRWRRSTARAELLDDLRERIAAHANDASGSSGAADVVDLRPGVNDVGTRPRRRNARPARTRAG
jgi:hypothetical protein